MEETIQLWVSCGFLNGFETWVLKILAAHFNAVYLESTNFEPKSEFYIEMNIFIATKNKGYTQLTMPFPKVKGFLKYLNRYNDLYREMKDKLSKY